MGANESDDSENSATFGAGSGFCSNSSEITGPKFLVSSFLRTGSSNSFCAGWDSFCAGALSSRADSRAFRLALVCLTSYSSSGSELEDSAARARLCLNEKRGAVF